MNPDAKCIMEQIAIADKYGNTGLVKQLQAVLSKTLTEAPPEAFPEPLPKPRKEPTHLDWLQYQLAHPSATKEDFFVAWTCSYGHN